MDGLLKQIALATEKGDKKTVDEVENTLGFMTPILKGFLTERGIEAANIGIQLYGGHGYIKSNKQEQVLRDVRISAIWEGTTGIQVKKKIQQRYLISKCIINFVRFEFCV